MDDGCVLVTGGAGYVGTHVLVELITAGYQVIAIDNREQALRECVEAIQEITGVQLIAHVVDLLKEQQIDNVFKQHKINCVLHLAGLKAVRESHHTPLLYYNVNVISSVNLLQVMAAHGVYRLLFSSSSKVYGEPQYLPLDEAHPTGACTNPYGRTKYMVEQILQDLTAADQRWKVIILRYFNPCGAHSSGRLGESRLGPPKNLMPCVCHAAMGKLKKLSIFGSDYSTPDGTAVKDYTHVVDLARGHTVAIKTWSHDQNFRVYNLGTGQTHSILEMVKTFEKISGRTIPVDLCDRKPGELGEVSADSSKANRELNWHAEKTLQHMCEDMWNWATAGDQQNSNSVESGNQTADQKSNSIEKRNCTGV